MIFIGEYTMEKTRFQGIKSAFGILAWTFALIIVGISCASKNKVQATKSESSSSITKEQIRQQLDSTTKIELTPQGFVKAANRDLGDSQKDETNYDAIKIHLW